MPTMPPAALTTMTFTSAGSWGWAPPPAGSALVGTLLDGVVEGAVVVVVEVVGPALPGLGRPEDAAVTA